ncbi:MAG: WD domain-containing protein [Hyperionvirus sp.]|uniref:WD domain-containing protein n=1 Tax=Hyperionvirus sp. TaxID=2487770 RepID=A0A3G5ABA5_9VIRU|nr:MAG: WD domain-containing protein [Hyperionvirus sp.]
MSLTAKAAGRQKYGKLSSLPRSIVEFILAWLEARDLFRVGRVSVAWNKIIARDTVWRLCVLSKWSPSSANAKRIVGVSSRGPSNTDWRSRYRELVRITRNWKMGHYEEVVLYGHTARVNTVSCGANILISCSEDKTIRIWDIQTRSCLHVLEGHTKPITDMRFDEKEVISASEDGTVRIWSIATGKEERRFQTIDHHDALMKAGGSDIDGLTFSVHRLKSTSDRIFCGGFQGQLYIWDRERGNPLHTILTPFPSILSSDRLPVQCIDAEGENLVVGVGDNVFLYDLIIHNGEYPSLPRLTLHHSSVRTIRILTPTLKTIVTIGNAHILIFSMTTGLLLQSLLIRVQGFIPDDIHEIQSPMQIFDRFVLETPDKEADSPDLSHVRVWRAFGQKITEVDAFKILVSSHHAKCSNTEVLVIADRPDHGLTLHDFTIPTPPIKKCQCVIS